jgi:hypothetical protein
MRIIALLMVMIQCITPAFGQTGPSDYLSTVKQVRVLVEEPDQDMSSLIGSKTDITNLVELQLMRGGMKVVKDRNAPTFYVNICGISPNTLPAFCVRLDCALDDFAIPTEHPEINTIATFWRNGFINYCPNSLEGSKREKESLRTLVDSFLHDWMMSRQKHRNSRTPISFSYIAPTSPRTLATSARASSHHGRHQRSIGDLLQTH